MELKINGRYNFKHQAERLIYMGKEGNWHQFSKIGDNPNVVWCELLDSNLHHIEETSEKD